MPYRVLLLGLLTVSLCSAQSAKVALKLNKNFRLSDSRGAVCVAKLLSRDNQSLTALIVRGKPAVCGPRGTRLEIASTDIVDVSPYRESRSDRAKKGLLVAAASSAIITAGVSVVFGTESAAAGLGIMFGGLGALTYFISKRDTAYSVLVTRIR